MPKDISRRDFLNGTALTITTGLAPIEHVLGQRSNCCYPPALEWLRGSTDASYQVIHALALQGMKFDISRLKAEETYDLVVVGAGLAGLTAAWSFREKRPMAKILILDNNDDFGGHARRTEHTLLGHTVIGYGGSESMVAPATKYTGELGQILKKLGIVPKRFEQESVFHRQLYPRLGLTKSVFFDRESFGRDKLVTGDPLVLGFDEFAPDNPGARPVADFLADCPLSDEARAGLLELFEGRRDYLDPMTAEAKIELLKKISYRAFLTNICRLPIEAANFFQGRSTDNWGFGIDALSAIDIMGDGYPGAKGLKIEDKVEGQQEAKVAYVHHFPDGNASLARALVRSMIKGVAPLRSPGSTMESLITAPFNYARLDQYGQRVRIRLESTAVCVRNNAIGKGVDVGYVKDGRLRRVNARKAVVATYAATMAHICPEIDKDRADLMRSNVKAPLVYTKVAIRNWESFINLRTHKISAPMSFHGTVKLDYPVSLGHYKFESDPKQPTVLHFVHVPTEPNKGLDMREQARAGRARLLRATFADFEAAIRRDLDRMLGPGGFDVRRDILAITVNRWSHGYSYTPTSLYDDVEALAFKQEAMKAKIGNIAFANSDTGWDAYAHTAMAEAVRAVGELTGERYYKATRFDAKPDSAPLIGAAQ
jgi:spermidine dehydrogenase